MQPDNMDWQIINTLSEDYVPYSVLARQLGVSEGTIRQRIKKLQKAGVLKIKGVYDTNVLDNQQIAIVAANVAESKLLDKKAGQIARLKNVISVSVISGQYDLMIEVLITSNKDLMHFLAEDLSSIDGVAKTESFLILKSYNKWV